MIGEVEFARAVLFTAGGKQQLDHASDPDTNGF
jgi:hypothetical protein